MSGNNDAAGQMQGEEINTGNGKGYAVGQSVGSGDTGKPPYPAGQVSGAHMDFGGKGDSEHGSADNSSADIKDDDGKGNTSHVKTEKSSSKVESSSSSLGGE